VQKSSIEFSRSSAPVYSRAGGYGWSRCSKKVQQRAKVLVQHFVAAEGKKSATK
jgi:hypothetical protein